MATKHTQELSDDDREILRLMEEAKAEMGILNIMTDFEKATNLSITEIKIINVGYTKKGRLKYIKIIAEEKRK